MYIRSSTDHAGAVAAIDIGSNSIHMVVARLDKAGHLEILDSDKVGVRLGAFLLADGTLSREGEERATKVVKHMAGIASAYKASVRAVATHAMREAKNHGEFIERIFKKTGVQIDIIDGVEEARLVFLGMRYALPLENQCCLGMDIGGGSTEFIVAKGDQVHFSTSLKVGAVTLTGAHFGKKTPTTKQVKNLHEYINLRIEPLVPRVHKEKFKKAIAASGTAKSLAMIHSRLFRNRVLKDENGYKLPVNELEAIVKALEELKSPKFIKSAFGIDADRSEILLAGAAIMREASRAFRIREWTITSFGVREGVVIDSFRRMGGERLGQIKDIRGDQVTLLGREWQIDEDYAGHVARLALEIFDKLAPLLFPKGGTDAWMGDRDLLRVAAWLHEAGKFISTSSYHRHTYYLINNCRLAGFTQDERHMIGLVALYHRKSAPKFDAAELSGLRKEEFERVVFLSAILRMASSLNRSRRGIVTGVRIKKYRGLKIGLKVTKGSDALVELQQVEREVEHLGKAFGWSFTVDQRKKVILGVAVRKESMFKKGTKKGTKKSTLKKVTKIKVIKATTKKSTKRARKKK